MTPKELARFERYVAKGAGCWTWTGSTKGGYGRFRIGSLKDGTRREVRAPRLYYEHFHGPIPADMLLLHICGNRNCVQPNHMVLGTHQDLSAFKHVRGTHRTGDQRGARNGMAKLTDRQALDILWLHQGMTNKAIAEQFGVDHSTVSAIRLGKTFKHLPRPETPVVKYDSMRIDPTPAIDLHKQGYGYRRISKITGIPKSTVQKYISAYRLQSAKASTI